MSKKMTDGELISRFDDALANGHIYVNYQAQINHTTGRMLGAEALMRWNDPEFGPQSPADFIPVLEKNGLIYRADLYVFECVCKFHKRCMDEGVQLMPISVNMSRFDIYNNNYIDSIEDIRKKYDIPVKYLRIEVTESSAIGGMELMSSVLSRLHSLGYLVEMDDFGSGYSSLNILKDLMVDIIKLDMIFILFTDILSESSEVFFTGKDADVTIENAFNGKKTGENSALLPGVVSRKKQFLPAVVSALQQ